MGLTEPWWIASFTTVYQQLSGLHCALQHGLLIPPQVLREQVNSDEAKIAAEIPEPREVASLSESTPFSETSTKTRASRKKRKRKRRSQAQLRIGNVKWNERQKFHGPWQYGPYEWRCEVKACHQVEAFPTFSSLEKHFRKVHHSENRVCLCFLEGQCAAGILSMTWFEIIVVMQANIGGSQSQ